jgi:phosphotransferase system enzyme I (PtsI)
VSAPADAAGLPGVVTAAPAEIRLGGIGVAPGVAIGPSAVYVGGGYDVEPERVAPDAVDAEIARFEAGVTRSERELARVTTVAREKLGDLSAGIFDAQALILRDPGFYDAVVERIRDEHARAGWAAQTVLGDIRQRLEAAPSAAMRERAADFLDVQNRLLRNLQKGRALAHVEPGTVVFAQNLTAADILLFSRRGVLGVVLDFGGPTSHVSIMARALGVPAVVSLHGLSGQVTDGEPVVLDGFSGTVVRHPSEETLARARRRAARFARLAEDAAEDAAEATETLDGHAVALRANVEFREELPLLHTYGAQGIGLFRTEMLFLSQGRALDEDHQLDVYRDAIRHAAPHPVTFRLVDLGGDKVLPLARREANPFLGWRGIRILLDKPDLLRPQLRAVLRAAADAPDDAPPQILLPMVSTVDEVRALRAAVTDTEAALEREGVRHRADLPVGIMVEVPAVALLADRFAAEVDFFSIGTNDLTQFTLAVDRGNDLVAGLYRALHPAVLCLIAQTCEAAHRAGRTVSVCGELAADPFATPLLVGLGVDALSASPAALGFVRGVLRSHTLVEAQALARRALDEATPAGVQRLLVDFLALHNPDLAALLSDEPDAP